MSAERPKQVKAGWKLPRTNLDGYPRGTYHSRSKIPCKVLDLCQHGQV